MLDRAELAQACAGLIDDIEQGAVRHLGDPLLLDAVRGATVVTVGADGWAFSRRSSHVDISPLYAGVVALAAVRRQPDGGVSEIF